MLFRYLMKWTCRMYIVGRPTLVHPVIIPVKYVDYFELTQLQLKFLKFLYNCCRFWLITTAPIISQVETCPLNLFIICSGKNEIFIF